MDTPLDTPCGRDGSKGSEGSEGKVLKMDRPAAGGFLSLTGPLAPRVADCPLGAQRTHFEGALATRKM